MLQGPGEGAGIVDIGDGLAVVFKAESHNHPSAVEPYEGAATGVGGIIRDIFSMGARPIALLDSLRFGELDNPRTKYLLEEVVAGIGGYGNCIGIPTVGGEIAFDPCYEGNPLVNAMCVGLIEHKHIQKGQAAGVGNSIMYVGAKTGRDGIHGATFASEEFNQEEEQQRSAVQVGDPFMEKLLLEACLELILHHSDSLIGIQDMGAAGLVSSSAEMEGTPGQGMVFVKVNQVELAVINMQARSFMVDLDDPFRKMNELVEEARKRTPIIFVDFHGETTSEKQAMGWFLDGKVSAVVGTHTHVQTNDARILPRGTAYLTDVGMTGPYDGILGMRREPVIEKFLTALPKRFEVVEQGRSILSGCILELDDTTGHAKEIQLIQINDDRPFME